MRSTTSSNELRTILRDCFRKYWTVPALGLAWFLLWGFLPLLLSTPADMMEPSLRSLSMNENFGYLTSILILSVGSGITVFSYLQNPASSDYMHSLPLKRDQLFGAHLLSGLLMMAVPVLINGIIMSLMAGNFLFVKWMIATGVCCFAIFSITVFAGMLSGNVLMHLFNTAFFCGFVSVFLLVYNTVCETLLMGYAASSDWMTALLLSNPLTAFLGNDVSRIMICVIYLITALAALALSALLYRRRRIERTGESVMFPWVRTGLFLYCIFCGSLLTGIIFAELLGNGETTGFGVPMIIGILIGALVIFLIGSVLIDRSAKVFTRRNLLPAALALLLALGSVWGLSTDITGYGSKVPDADRISAVYLDPQVDGLFRAGATEIYYGWGSRFDASYYDTEDLPVTELGGHKVIGMRSSEAIDAVRRIHRELISQQDAAVSGDSYALTVELAYELKNGRQMRRSYLIHLRTDENGAADISGPLRQAAAAYYNCAEFKDNYSLKKLRPEVFGSGSITYYPHPAADEEADGVFKSYAIPGKYASQLQGALEADFRESSYEDSRTCTSFFTVALAGSSWEEIAIPVPKGASHTKSWLQDHRDLLQQ
ncbi:MAG: hypothetical protein IJ109_06345 [Firmicutes bacterium]|nr:hypothetical protein [Bacillota bacterium]